jgi:hypothetical protein
MALNGAAVVLPDNVVLTYERNRDELDFSIHIQ